MTQEKPLRRAKNQVGDKTFVSHIRSRRGTGGLKLTIVCIEEGNVAAIGLAQVASEDQPCYALGRKIAEGRARKAIEEHTGQFKVSRFAITFPNDAIDLRQLMKLVRRAESEGSSSGTICSVIGELIARAVATRPSGITVEMQATGSRVRG